MAKEPLLTHPTPPSLSTRIFESILAIYRQSFKRIYPIHAALHWGISRSLIPLLERSKRFKTISDDPFWFRLELLLNKHELESTQRLRRIIKPGMVALDIGAHVGYYTRLFAELVGEEGRVLAFEPNPQTYETLAHNIRAYPQISLHQVAVSNREGQAELYDYLMMSASGSLHYNENLRELERSQVAEYDIAPRVKKDFDTRTFKVRTVALDNYLAAQGIDSIDFIKMDIEGAEMDALRGASEIIRNSPQLQMMMEYNPQALSSFDIVPQEAVQEVLNMGFQNVYCINKDGSLDELSHDPQKLDELTHSLEQHIGVVNLLFTREQ